jgi:hypothetical protein
MHGREPQPARIDRQNRNTMSHNVCAMRAVCQVSPQFPKQPEVRRPEG